MHHTPMRRPLDLETLVLEPGAHAANEGQHMNVMEAVAHIAGEPWSHRPECASPVLAAFCRRWNDTVEPYGSAIRKQLKHYIPRLIGSRGTAAQEEARAWMAVDWLLHESQPAWLRLAGLTEHAERLAALRPQTIREALEASLPAWIAALSAASAAARRAALSAGSMPGSTSLAIAIGVAIDAANDAANEAATAAIEQVASAAAEEATRAIVEDTTWGTASEAAKNAGWTAAKNFAHSAAWDAASAAARAAASDALGAVRNDASVAVKEAAFDVAWNAAENAARAAARAPAEEALRATTERLQASAWLLLERMLAVTESQVNA